MKQPTLAAWRKMLAKYETFMNEVMPLLSEEERYVLYATHDVLRLRASGGKADVQAAD